MPGYIDEKVISFLSKFKVNWKLYSKYTRVPYRVQNVIVKPIDNKNFLNDLGACSGVFCGAGFELPSEVMYLQKKLVVMPLKGQFEQICNAHCLKLLGISVVNSLNSSESLSIQRWIDEPNCIVELNYKDCTDAIAQRINFIYQRSLFTEHQLSKLNST